jgi:hypothetical protein
MRHFCTLNLMQKMKQAISTFFPHFVTISNAWCAKKSAVTAISPYSGVVLVLMRAAAQENIMQSECNA